MKKVLAVLLGLGLIMSAAGCQSAGGAKETKAVKETQGGSSSEETVKEESQKDTAGESSDVFVLGCPQPLTGTNALPGGDAYNAVRLAAKQINAQGGFQGKQIKVVSYDDQGSPEEAVKISTKLVEVDHADAVIGSCISSCLLSSSGILNDNKIPVLGTGTSPTWMQKGWEYVFRACQNADTALPVLVDFWKEEGFKKVGIFAGQDDAAVAGSKTVQKLCEEAGIEVTTVENYVEGDTDFSGQCAKLINSGAELMFISTYGPTQPLIAKQLRQYGFKGLCFTKDLYQLDALSVAGAASNGFAFAYPYLTYNSVDDCSIPIVKEFLASYEAEYHELPTSDCAYRAYDSVMVLKKAVEMAGSTDGEKIKDAINKISGMEALGGTIDFTKGDGEAFHTCKIFVIANEKYTTMEEWKESGGYDAFLKQ